MDQLVEETGYSKSTVSSNMSTLERQGLAKRVIIQGDKRYHYIPVTDPDSLKKDLIIKHEARDAEHNGRSGQDRKGSSGL